MAVCTAFLSCLCIFEEYFFLLHKKVTIGSKNVHLACSDRHCTIVIYIQFLKKVECFHLTANVSVMTPVLSSFPHQPRYISSINKWNTKIFTNFFDDFIVHIHCRWVAPIYWWATDKMLSETIVA